MRPRLIPGAVPFLKKETALSFHKKITNFYDDSYTKEVIQKKEIKEKKSRDFAIRFNELGNPVITVKRKPKFLTKKEILTLKEETGRGEAEIWGWLRERKIEIRD